MAYSSEIIAKLGLDPSGFKSGLDRAESRVTAFQSRTIAGFSGVSRSLADLQKLFIGGALFNEAKSFFSAAIEYARTYKGAVDEDVLATQRFAAELEKWNTATASATTFVVGAIERATVGIASLIYGVDAASDAWNKMQEATQAALDKRRMDEYQAALDRLGKTNRDIAYSEADNWGKLTILLNEQIALREKIREVGKETVQGATLLADLAKSEAESRKVLASITAEEQRAATAKAVEEARTGKALTEQADLRAKLVTLANEEAAAARKKLEAEASAAVLIANNAAKKQGFDPLTADERDQLTQWIMGGRQGPEPVITRAGNLSESMAAPLTSYRNEMLGPMRNRDDFSQASDAVIDELIRRYKAQISRISDVTRNPSLAPDVATGDFTRGLAVYQVSQNLRYAEEEQRRRR